MPKCIVSCICMYIMFGEHSMKMRKVVLICILKSIFISFVSSQDAVVPTRYCFIVGQLQVNTTQYQFSVTDLPGRCEIIAYGNFVFDSSPHMYEEDKGAIRSMVEANKTVYVFITYDTEDSWKEVLSPQRRDTYMERKILLINELQDLRISGIIMGVELGTLFNEETGYANTMSEFINEVKQEIPNLLFGLSILGMDLYNRIQTGIAPDFSITNPILDFYVAKVFSKDWVCFEDDDYYEGMISTDTLCQTFNTSGIDMKKTAAAWDIAVYNLVNDTTYSELCSSELIDWCAEDSKYLYEDGAFLKTYFPWIWMRCIDFDDTKGTCECGLYPATNKVFDGWENIPLDKCMKLDRP